MYDDNIESAKMRTELAAAGSQTVVGRQHNLLDEAIGVLRERVDRLTKQLHPALRPEGPTDPSNALSTIDESTSPIADDLRRSLRSVNAIVAAVEDLVERLEI